MVISTAEARVDLARCQTGNRLTMPVRHLSAYNTLRIAERTSCNFMMGSFTQLYRRILIFGKLCQK
jgi:hypothetical protein